MRRWSRPVGSASTQSRLYSCLWKRIQLTGYALTTSNWTPIFGLISFGFQSILSRPIVLNWVIETWNMKSSILHLFAHCIKVSSNCWGTRCWFVEKKVLHVVFLIDQSLWCVFFNSWEINWLFEKNIYIDFVITKPITFSHTLLIRSLRNYPSGF